MYKYVVMLSGRTTEEFNSKLKELGATARVINMDFEKFGYEYNYIGFVEVEVK